jgi:hypothetical protein
MEILGKYVVSTQNIVHNAETHPTNCSANFTSDRANVGSFLHGPLIVEGPNQF